MVTRQTDAQISGKPLRLWPGVVIVALQSLMWFGLPAIKPDLLLYGVIGGFGGGLAIVVWWAFFSRAQRVERWSAMVLMAAAVAATPRILHESIATGMMGLMFFMYAVPVLSLAFVGWAAASRRLATGARLASMAAAILLACGAFALLRTGGMTGDADSDFRWRWTETSEERLLARVHDEPAALAPAPAARGAGTERASPPAVEMPAAAPPPAPAEAVGEATADWPGFRGPGRDSVVRGLRIDTDWTLSPPFELWRRPVGPGWSSFAVRGKFFYTQEQLGDDEIVACYRLDNGQPIWRHRDPARFWESNAGAGPRATPTVRDGLVYTLGATGILNALDAGDGAVVWSRNAASDTGTEVPGWGFASSPLVVNDVVVAATAGALAAYDRDTGVPRWSGPKGGWGYSSPHLLAIGGVPQILLSNGAGVISVAPADGALLWEHKWTGDGIVQPALTEEGDVLIGTGSGMGSGAAVGIRRIGLAPGPGGWTVQERWTSIGLKPYYNDFVVHDGHAFGFDGGILACIDLGDGRRKWKGGRYGHGQVLLLADQGLLLVLSEKGELALVAAAPGQFTEVARFPAIEGKTWNHPALAGDILLVRNAEEMAAFRLPLARN